MEQLTLSFNEAAPSTPPPSRPGVTVSRVWDAESRTFIYVESFVFTGPQALYTLVPDRFEKTSPIYDEAQIDEVSIRREQRMKAHLCSCGCKEPTKQLKTGEYNKFLPGHNRRAHWRGV